MVIVRFPVHLFIPQSFDPVQICGIPCGINAESAERKASGGLALSIDGISFVVASILFLAIALLSAYLPSRRAMHVDPMVPLSPQQPIRLRPRSSSVTASERL